MKKSNQIKQTKKKKKCKIGDSLEVGGTAENNVYDRKPCKKISKTILKNGNFFFLKRQKTIIYDRNRFL